MKLLLTDNQLEDRRTIVRGPLAPLADSLSADLKPLLGRAPYIPTQKALLSKVGGRCETDGTDLEFDPLSPHAHRCLQCGRTHTGEYHDRWWLYPYQLWLAERAVHAATLSTVCGDARHAAFARDVLTGYADRYLDYPNRDNVLGPSRLFFSTYLESLWLLHVCIAADALEGAGDQTTADDVRERIVLPAVELIEEYDEGLSNRQVWNAAAIIAARTLLGESTRSSAVERAFSSIETILMHAVGDDGSWYEGDNYHQFAHRGLWYAIALGERAGYQFDSASLDRFEAGFAAPFRSALPDFTYPARKDSRYAASLRQWRFAESCELGIARRDDSLLSWALSRMYATDIAPGDTGRARSSGEAERHVPPVRLTRADLGWRSLLFAKAALPAIAAEAPTSLTIASQGLTIHRREHGAVYVALDWGESGGGHGHPDRLNLLFSHGARRWLDDLGTGSYVDDSLHWYRSTLAHNAPLIDGRSQVRINGECVGDERADGFDFVSARADALAPGVSVTRTIVTGDGYFVDEVRWTADHSIRFELPVHFHGACDLELAPQALEGGTDLEDGFRFVHDSVAAKVGAGVPVHLRADGASATLWCDQDVALYRTTAPGQPASAQRSFYLLRCTGTGGVIRSVWSWSPAPIAAEFRADGIAVSLNGAVHDHAISDSEWLVSIDRADAARFERGSNEAPDADYEDSTGAGAPFASMPHELRIGAQEGWFDDLSPSEQASWATFELGAAHYRRSEDSWTDAGGPTARVAVAAVENEIIVDILVLAESPMFVPADSVNPFDNEQPDLNGHGVQLYIATDEASGGWVLVPELGSDAVRVRRLNEWGRFPSPTATWREVAGGFEVQVRLPFNTEEPAIFGLDLIANDSAPGRERRRGQLVMSGADDDFVYLRGDRHDPGRLIPFAIE